MSACRFLVRDDVNCTAPSRSNAVSGFQGIVPAQTGTGATNWVTGAASASARGACYGRVENDQRDLVGASASQGQP